MILRPLELKDEQEAVRGHHELALENWEYLLTYEAGMEWNSYLDILEGHHLGKNLPTGRVPATFLIADHEGDLIGRASIRHELNDYLMNFGGHIGYGVRPAFRNRGFAGQILAQSLKLINAMGVREVLITCTDENIASRKVIEAHGGILENIVDQEGRTTRRYWITHQV